MSTPTRPVLRWHGGKWMLAPWILQHFPPHRVYVEPFGGAASVLMRKPRAALVDVYNDLDGDVVNVFRVLREPAAAARLADLLTCTPYARAEYELSYRPTYEPVERARRAIVRAFMGFGSDSASGATTGFRANGNRNKTHPAKDWTNYPRCIPAFVERLAGVAIESRPAVEMIRQHDAPDTLHYCDPPYPLGTRSARQNRAGKAYRHEMTDDDHRSLAEVLHGVAGMVVLSGYPCDLYDRELYPDWHRVERAAMADGARKRTEVLWMNERAAAGLHPTLWDGAA